MINTIDIAERGRIAVTERQKHTVKYYIETSWGSRQYLAARDDLDALDQFSQFKTRHRINDGKKKTLIREEKFILGEGSI